jgi:hypothetical protein
MIVFLYKSGMYAVFCALFAEHGRPELGGLLHSSGASSKP